MVEPVRRHGPFDTRYPRRPRLAAAAWKLEAGEGGPERLGWPAFVERFFPGSRRHDLDALAAYESYGNARERASGAAAGAASAPSAR